MQDGGVQFEFPVSDEHKDLLEGAIKNPYFKPESQEPEPANQDSAGTSQEPAEEPPTIINEGAAEPPAAPKKAEKKAAPQPAAPAKKSRETKTVSFKNIPEPGQPQSEFDYLDAIVQARIEAGITQDWNQFIRQCIDYTVNNEFSAAQTDGITFARPDLPRVFLHNGFFHNKK